MPRPKTLTGIKEGRKLSKSNFFITINTQKRPDSFRDPDEFINCFENACRELFEDENLQSDLIVFNDPMDAPHMEELIEDIYVSGGREIGEKQQKIHSHILYEISHRSKLRLDYSFIREFIKTHCGIEQEIYVNVRLVHNNHTITDTERAKLYAEKGDKRIF